MIIVIIISIIMDEHNWTHLLLSGLTIIIIIINIIYTEFSIVNTITMNIHFECSIGIFILN